MAGPDLREIARQRLARIRADVDRSEAVEGGASRDVRARYSQNQITAPAVDPVKAAEQRAALNRINDYYAANAVPPMEAAIDTFDFDDDEAMLNAVWRGDAGRSRDARTARLDAVRSTADDRRILHGRRPSEFGALDAMNEEGDMRGNMERSMSAAEKREIEDRLRRNPKR